MVLPVADHIVPHPHQGADNAQVGLEPRGEGHHILLPEKVSHFSFKVQVQLQGTVEQAAAAAAGAVFRQGRLGGGLDIRVGGQTQVVVGPQHDAPAALHAHLCVLPGFQLPEVGKQIHLPELVHLGAGIAFFKNIHKYLVLYNMRY